MASLTARCETTIANGELSFYGGFHSREPGMAEEWPSLAAVTLLTSLHHSKPGLKYLSFGCPKVGVGWT